jgi:hypothetical protein
MPTSKEPSKQPSRPRKSTRASKAAAATSETQVPLTTTADGDRHSADADTDHGSFDSPATMTDGQPHADDMSARIRQRAYEIYQARGYSTGNELEDWLEAERQLRADSNQTESRASDDATA